MDYRPLAQSQDQYGSCFSGPTAVKTRLGLFSVNLFCMFITCHKLLILRFDRMNFVVILQFCRSIPFDAQPAAYSQP